MYLVFFTITVVRFQYSSTSTVAALTSCFPVILVAREGSSFGVEAPFYGQILAITVVGAALVKWGELYLDFPFEPSYAAAAALVLGPTALNAKKWADRSKDPSAAIESII